MRQSTRMMATVSIYKNGTAYIGREAMHGLNLGYSDGVEVRFRDLAQEGGDLVKSGFINNSNQIYVGTDLYRKVSDESDDGPVRVEGIVKKGNDTWETAKGRTEERHADYHTLNARRMRENE